MLDAAAKAFAVRGLGVPIDEIAAAAGVGPGTVHRNYPTKELLFEAIVIDRMEELTRAAAALDAAGDPGFAFFSFLDRMTEAAARNKAVAEALTTGGSRLSPKTQSAKRALTAALVQLLHGAQKRGAVRADVQAIDVTSLIWGTLQGEPGADPAARRRLLSIINRGLR